MTRKMHGALIASLAAAALLLGANATFARSGAAVRGGVAPPHPMFRPGVPFRHHPRGAGTFWPGGGGFFYAPPDSAAAALEVPQPITGDMRYTYTYDVPWDWAHRFPPNVVPSDRPYISSCPAETVTVPGRGGAEHTVNVMRCY